MQRGACRVDAYTVFTCISTPLRFTSRKQTHALLWRTEFIWLRSICVWLQQRPSDLTLPSVASSIQPGQLNLRTCFGRSWWHRISTVPNNVQTTLTLISYWWKFSDFTSQMKPFVVLKRKVSVYIVSEVIELKTKVHYFDIITTHRSLQAEATFFKKNVFLLKCLK